MNELRQGTKLVYIDFFFVACSPCEYLLDEELPYYKSLDQSVKDQFLMIMVDTNYQDTIENINFHRKRKEIPDEIITMRSGYKVYSNVKNNGGVPHGAFLDENGKIISLSRGDNFKEMIQKYLISDGQSVSEREDSAFEVRKEFPAVEQEKRRYVK